MFEVDGSLLSKIYSIQDCRIYDDDRSNSLSKYASNSATYNSTEKAFLLNINSVYINREPFLADF